MFENVPSFYHVSMQTYTTNNDFFVFFSPELKPVEKELEVTIKFPDVEPLNPPVLSMSDIKFAYNPEKVIFTSVNLGANLESRICIVSIVIMSHLCLLHLYNLFHQTLTLV
jgi:ABC-type transport system involved in Fe-S cluster assembly fused permease/ATPase subunit